MNFFLISVWDASCLLNKTMGYVEKNTKTSIKAAFLSGKIMSKIYSEKALCY